MTKEFRTYRIIFQATDRNLTKKEVARVKKDIFRKLKDKFGVEERV